jgi:hypothetical protein
LLDLGILLSPEGWGGRSAVAGLLAAAREATSRGWSLWIPEHVARSDYVGSSLVMAGVVLGAVPAVRVATAGVIAGVRDPESVVRDADVLAEVAAAGGGQFSLGAVAGYQPSDLPAERFERRYDALDALVSLVSERRRAWPLLIGAATPVGLARAARAGGWLAGTRQPLGELSSLIERYRELAPCGTVVVLRRWVPAGRPDGLERHPLGDGVRTPKDALVGGGRKAVARQLRALREAGAATVVLGPVSSPDSLALLADDLVEWERATEGRRF